MSTETAIVTVDWTDQFADDEIQERESAPEGGVTVAFPDRNDDKTYELSLHMIITIGVDFNMDACQIMIMGWAIKENMFDHLPEHEQLVRVVELSKSIMDCVADSGLEVVRGHLSKLPPSDSLD